MPLQPSSDRRLAQTAGNQNTTGARLLLLGGVLFAIGLVLMLAGSGIVDFFGVLLAALATPPTLAGIGMMLSGLVGHHASERRLFA
jgi:hypothetical protein